jgi:spore photoproduct lyase
MKKAFGMWRPREIILHEKVKEDPAARAILQKCSGTPVQLVSSARAAAVAEASAVLQKVKNRGMLEKILAGKQVLFIAPAGGNEVDRFAMPDDRIVCPDFDRLKFAANGCYYQCDWCYLKLTYRAVFPYITVRAEYTKLANQVRRRLNQSDGPVIFNSGELADSLSLEHLTGAARWFIPWFAKQPNGYLFMLTKSDHVADILQLEHNRHTIIAWSLNDEAVSRKFEIGAPSFKRRLAAARKAQEAGYPVRIRLDPIVPLNGWKERYKRTIEEIFKQIRPERVTLGTLRFEEGFYHQRESIFASGPELPGEMEKMQPMFPPRGTAGKKRPAAGKYSYDEQKRTEIFSFAIDAIRQHSDCRVALCKESAAVWKNLGLALSRCSCVCQLDSADMEPAEEKGAD